MNHEPTRQLTKRSFIIKGMHCASCVYTTEKALKGLPGVKEAVVNLATGKAMVDYEPDKVSDKKFIQAIASVGYQAVLGNKEINNEEVLKILVDRHDFSEERVNNTMNKLMETKEKKEQKGLSDFLR